MYFIIWLHIFTTCGTAGSRGKLWLMECKQRRDESCQRPEGEESVGCLFGTGQFLWSGTPASGMHRNVLSQSKTTDWGSPNTLTTKINLEDSTWACRLIITFYTRGVIYLKYMPSLKILYCRLWKECRVFAIFSRFDKRGMSHLIRTFYHTTSCDVH